MIVLSLILTALAESPDTVTSSEKLKSSEASTFSSTGNLRLNATSRPGFVVDFEGRSLDSGLVLDSRLRTQVNWKQNGWKYEFGGDLLHGQFAGAAWNLDGSEHRYHPEEIGVFNSHNFLLRSAQAKRKFGSFAVQTGVTTSHWGLGLVANDGNHNQLFSRTDYGDRVFRTAVISRPVEKMVLMLGGDWVIEDDIGGYTDGHLAYQGLASMQYIVDKDNAAGFLTVYRHQSKMETQKVLEGVFLDGYAKSLQQVGPMQLYTAFEAAYIYGNHGQISNRLNPEGLKVRSYGGVAQLEARHRHGNIGLNGGFASGDGNPSDDVYSTFSMDRDYNAGSVLFDLHQAAVEVATYNLVTDPEHSGTPPDGVEFAVTEGAIRQAMYLQPSITIKKLPKKAQLAIGSVLAWQTTPISSPFISYREGGAIVNHLGNPTDGYQLGVEMNWALMIQHEYKSGLKNALSIEGAHVLPSDNLGLDEGLSLFRIQSNVGW